METELAELEKKWESLVEKFDSLARVHLYRIVIAKAEKILAGLDHIFSIVVCIKLFVMTKLAKKRHLKK